MKLTERKAIGKSIELWEWLAETGEYDKEDWDGWEDYGEAKDECFLCEYAIQKSGTDMVQGELGRCVACPYYIKYGGKCFKNDTPYVHWDEADTKKDKIKYAKQFLAQLRKLSTETVTIEIEIDTETFKTISSLHELFDTILEGLSPEDREKLEIK